VTVGQVSNLSRKLNDDRLETCPTFVQIAGGIQYTRVSLRAGFARGTIHVENRHCDCSD
jgi:hypothetical protein